MARAADYPSRPIRLLVGWPTGAATDLGARILADGLTQKIGQRVVVENRPGGSSVLAAGDVARATPDGYTLLWTGSDVITILPAVKSDLPYKTPDSFSYLSRVVDFHIMIVVGNKSPIGTMPDLLSYARANPGKLRYGTSGVGGISHVSMLLVEQRTGIQMTLVPYKGAGPALVDMAGGFIDLMFTSIGSAQPFLDSGKLKVIAVSGAKRESYLPNVPTLEESGVKDADISDSFIVIGPAGIPADIIARFHQAVLTTLADPVVKQRFAAVGLEPAPLTGDPLRQAVIDEYKQWSAVAAAANLHITD